MYLRMYLFTIFIFKNMCKIIVPKPKYWFIKNRTKLSSVLLLSMVRFKKGNSLDHYLGIKSILKTDS